MKCDGSIAENGSRVTADLILSLFPGADLLGRGFEAEGFCVVRGPDLLWGQDIRSFHSLPGVFEGVIAGTPCQDFSKARRSEPTGNGLAMIAEFSRVVTESEPVWWLLENVPSVPDVAIPGYTVQRFNVSAADCGIPQRRLRRFQFGSVTGKPLAIPRGKADGRFEACCLAGEGTRQSRRGFADFCRLQGLPAGFDLPGLSLETKYRLVGNGVPVAMAAMIARAIKAQRLPGSPARLCLCECGRPVTGAQLMATAACRKRMERLRRDRLGAHKADGVTAAPVTVRG